MATDNASIAFRAYVINVIRFIDTDEAQFLKGSLELRKELIDTYDFSSEYLDGIVDGIFETKQINPKTYMSTQTYEIIRFYHPSMDKANRVMKRGLTLEQAQAHCKHPSSRKDNEYFDGYDQE